MSELRNNHKIDSWFLDNLICPRDGGSLDQVKNGLICENNHEYPIVQSVPVMLVPELPQTHKTSVDITLDIVNRKSSDRDKNQLPEPEEAVDSFVQQAIAATNSNFYKHLQGKLDRYPIPHLPYPLANRGTGTLLDIGCNWGRWCIAAAKSGYIPVGIDPNLEAILAAKRIAQQLGVSAKYLVGDSRFLPFKPSTFDHVYSYSVFQHFSKQDVRESLYQVARVLTPNGTSIIQMLNKFGLRGIYAQAKRGFKEPSGFETRYWSPSELLDTFSQCIGPSELLVGSFFTQAQVTDKDLFTLRDRIVFEIAELLKHISWRASLLTNLADNLFLCSKSAKDLR